MLPEIKRESGVIASTLEVVCNWTLPNCFVGIKYYDADPKVPGSNEVTPGAGSIAVTAKLVNHDKYVDITDGTFDCTIINAFASFKGNAYNVKAIPTGITTAVYYEVIVSQNAI